LLSWHTACVVWTILLLASLAASVRILWILSGRPSGQLHLLAFCLAPMLTCVMAGQIGIFLLLSVALFLRYHHSHPFLAGAALLPCSWKPHLFLAVGIVLVLWSMHRKAYRVLMGTGAALLGACTIAFCFDPHAWSHHAQKIAIARPTDLLVPNLSGVLRHLVDRDAVWLQFLPAMAACAWAAWYFWSRRDRWNWMEQGMLLLLVSVACAPYSWLTDEAVLLPALLVALYATQKRGGSLLPFALLASAPLAALLGGHWITAPFFAWTAPSWVVWYLYATRTKSNSPAGSLIVDGTGRVGGR
jgi:hypothetical protein